jgi:hypothetical protein
MTLFTEIAIFALGFTLGGFGGFVGTVVFAAGMAKSREEHGSPGERDR